MYRLKLTGTDPYLDNLYKDGFRYANWDEKDLFVYVGPFEYIPEEFFYLRHKGQTTKNLVHKSMFEPVPPSTNLEDYM